MQSFVVIPHRAREDNFFNAVFEDGIRVMYSNRLQSLLFSHVLSPAHHPAQHINGPLLEAVRDGRNATLVVALPAVDDMSDDPSSASPSSSSAVRAHEELEDASEVTMEVYGNLFPLLFRSAENCPEATVTAVTVSAHDRGALDVLSGLPVRSLLEVQREVIPRAGSASHWGALMRTLASRHAELSSSTDLLASQTALVITIDLRGYGTVVVVDVGCDQDLLQGLSLTLRMNGACGARTCPPRSSALCNLLRDCVSADDAVQVLVVPAPAAAPRTSMRILRFAAEFEVARSAAAGGVTRVDSLPDEERAAPYLKRSRAAAAEPTSRGGQFSSTSRSKETKADAGAGFIKSAADMTDSNDVREHLTYTSLNDAAASDPSASQLPRYGVPRRTARRSPELFLDDGDEHVSAAAAAAAMAARQAREQSLLKRNAFLEAALKQQSTALSAAESARAELQRELNSALQSLQARQSDYVTLRQAHRRLQRENADVAKAVPELLTKVNELDKEKKELVLRGAQAARRLTAQRAKAAELERALAELRRRLEEDEQEGMRHSRQHKMHRTLSNSHAEHLRRGVNSSATHDAHVARGRLRDSSELSSSGNAGGAADEVAEVRQRNVVLEVQVARMEERLRAVQELHSAQSDLSVSPHRRSPPRRSSDVLEERVRRLSTELADVRRTNEELLRWQAQQQQRRDSAPAVRAPAQRTSNVVSSGDPSAVLGETADGGVREVARSLAAGCVSLQAQLQCLATALQPLLGAVRSSKDAAPSSPAYTGSARSPTALAGLSPTLIEEHVRAVAALQQSVDQIGSRRWGEGRDDRVPVVATAADVSALASRLHFEMERCAHLHAFLPTFAQLAVATEHLRQRTRLSQGTS